MFYTDGEDIKYEIFPQISGKRMIIYLKKTKKGFVRKNKCFGTHYLEQIFDENNRLLNEKIKENPHFVNLDNFSDNFDFD